MQSRRKIAKILSTASEKTKKFLFLSNRNTIFPKCRTCEHIPISCQLQIKFSTSANFFIVQQLLGIIDDKLRINEIWSKSRKKSRKKMKLRKKKCLILYTSLYRYSYLQVTWPNNCKISMLTHLTWKRQSFLLSLFFFSLYKEKKNK